MSHTGQVEGTGSAGSRALDVGYRVFVIAVLRVEGGHFVEVTRRPRHRLVPGVRPTRGVAAGAPMGFCGIRSLTRGQPY